MQRLDTRIHLPQNTEEKKEGQVDCHRERGDNENCKVYLKRFDNGNSTFFAHVYAMQASANIE